MRAGWTPDWRDLESVARGDGQVAGPGAPGRPGPAPFARFRAWDGSQGIPNLDADDVMDALRDDLLAEGDLRGAIERLMERGIRGDGQRPDLPGLRDLLDRLSKRRRELLDEGRLGDVLGDVRRELGEIVDQERAGIDRRESEAAQSAPNPALEQLLRDQVARRREQLEALPPGVGERIRALQDYEFMDQGARQRFEDLTDRLRKQVVDRYAAGLSDALRDMQPEDLSAAREMVRDLNRLLGEKLAGGDPDAAEFLAKHGGFFPGAETLDDVIDQLAQRMAATQSLLRSLSPEQRAELQSTMDALLRDDRLRWDLAQLAGALDQLLPEGLGQRYRFGGQEDMSLEQALGQLDRLGALDRLAEDIATAESPGDLASVDRGAATEALGPEAAAELDTLERLGRTLEEAGYATRSGDRLELTPRGSRQIGQKVLDELFARLRRDAFGGHEIDRSGQGGERTEETKPYEFGDAFHLDLRATISNALRREENAPGVRDGGPVTLAPGDFEVARTEQLTAASTVLLVDLSRSMLLRGCFLAAKKVALALHTLIRTQYPRDRLTVVGFAYHAREIAPEALAELQLNGYEYGTNLQHGLMLARRILARGGSPNREIVVITDGEPTAHFEGDQVDFNYPPTRRTIQATLREVDRCTREGIVINTFMLERSRALADFVNLMTQRNRGRAFHAEPEHLGEYVLVDFVKKRTRRVA